jgi:hypothetical protein
VLCESGDLSLWDLRNSKQPLQNKKLHKEAGLSFAYDQEHHRFVSGSADNKIVYGEITKDLVF